VGLKTQEICKSFIKEPITIKASITSLREAFEKKKKLIKNLFL